jgi:hypothetical protein
MAVHLAHELSSRLGLAVDIQHRDIGEAEREEPGKAGLPDHGPVD